MDKPTLEHVEWVFKHLNDHLKEGGSFRHLIYDRMGFPPDAYSVLYMAGGQNISNAFFEARYYLDECTCRKKEI